MVESINEIIGSMKFSYRKLNEINDKSMKGNINSKIAYTEYVADKLTKIFNAPQSRRFFLKCAWNLSENTIWSAVEDSQKKSVKSPIALFVFICNRALKERAIDA